MSKRILVAEDDPSILLSLEFLLKSRGHQVTAVANGEAAWRALAQDPPDLALLDVMLPALDGLEICRRMRAHDAFRDTRVLMLSARGRESEVQAGLMRGADAYMTKPFGSRELLAEVARLLGDEVGN